MDSKPDIIKKKEQLTDLVKQIKEVAGIANKIQILDEQNSVSSFVRANAVIREYLNQATPEGVWAIKQIAALGQGEIVFRIPSDLTDAQRQSALERLVERLCKIDRFYATLGGILGYHLKVLEMLHYDQDTHQKTPPHVKYLEPEGLDISQDTLTVRQAVIRGIQHLDNIAELYPVGGAGDRLDLRDSETDEPLPSARLLFGGQTLLEGMIRDLQAREYLHYQLYGKQLCTPIAMMTSREKHNHQHVMTICEEAEWFGRPKDSYCFFIQPGAPVITEEGNWSMSAPLTLSVKPGGHGVIWKLAETHGVFGWFRSQNRSKMLLRQINNPIAGTDHGLLTFTGIGCHENRGFGFASCSRLLHAAEGMNVLIETTGEEGEEGEGEEGYRYVLTNIEYTDFAQSGIGEPVREKGTPYSAYPANTNILFADLDVVEDLVARYPVPGLLLNMKKTAPFVDEEGRSREVLSGRLESTMQNIADNIVAEVSHPLEQGESRLLPTYLTYNDRNKTISVTKQAYVPGGGLLGTPEGCFYDILENNRELLAEECGLSVPALGDEGYYMRTGPKVLFTYHPALGPLYSIIRQKIQGGQISEHGELQLEIAELEMTNLRLTGSLLITSDAVMGKKNSDGVLRYGSEAGKCVLHDVAVVNEGIDRTQKNVYWKNEIHRHEALTILLHGNAEFIAKRVVFRGDETIEVPEGLRMEAYMEEGEVKYRSEPVPVEGREEERLGLWKYAVTDDYRVVLERKWGN